MQSEIEMLRETTKRLEGQDQLPEEGDLDIMRDQLRDFEAKY